MLALALNAGQVCAWGAQDSDKQKHLLASSAIASVTYELTDSPWATLGVCLGTGALKEWYDKHDYGVFSAEDMQANAIGCAAGVALGYWLFDSNQGLTLTF